MKQLKVNLDSRFANYLQTLENIPLHELEALLLKCTLKHFKKGEIFYEEGDKIDEMFFVEKGIVRASTFDKRGKEYTTNFYQEEQFFTDYAALSTGTPIFYNFQALEDTQVISISNESLEWFYNSTSKGEKIGRILSGYFMIFMNERVRNLYILTPKERYDLMNSIFPNIHQRVPQHMIASYIGITKVHLSRIKKI